MKLAIIGCTGLVGSVILKVLDEFSVIISDLTLVASSKNTGKKIEFRNENLTIFSIEEALKKKPDIVIFSAGSYISEKWAPKFSAVGSKVIDNSSFWRMKTNIPLVVPEINGFSIKKSTKIIANPNCSTIQLSVALNEIHKKFGLKRIVISTYQSEIDINDAVINEAKRNVPTKGMDVGHLYTNVVDQHLVDAKSQDGKPGRGLTIAHTGNSFPNSITEGQYVLRTDYSPSRLFRKEGNRYIKVSDDFRGTYVSSNKQLDSFINNTNSSAVTEDNKERQYLSKVVKPKVD
mgnify:CR=1 FL=1